MSIRSEIRAALVDGPKSVDELMLILPSRETTDRARLSNNMSVLATEQKVRRCGLSDEGKPLYQLEPGMWPGKEAAGDPADQTAAKATTEAAPPAKRGRKTKAATQSTTRKGRKPATPRKAAKGTKPAPARTPSPARAQRPDAKAARKPARGKAAGKRARQPAAALDLSGVTDQAQAMRLSAAWRRREFDVVSNLGANQQRVGGSHYRALDPQPWDVIVAWDLGFLAGNVIKYVARAGRKGDNERDLVEDLRKARHYLDKLLELKVRDAAF